MRCFFIDTSVVLCQFTDMNGAMQNGLNVTTAAYFYKKSSVDSKTASDHFKAQRTVNR